MFIREYTEPPIRLFYVRLATRGRLKEKLACFKRQQSDVRLSIHCSIESGNLSFGD